MLLRQNTLENIIGDAVCTAAVTAVAYRSLKVLVTLQHLGIPEGETVPDVKANAPSTPAASSPSRFRRVMKNKKVAAAFGILMGLTIYGLLIFIFAYAMPRFTSVTFLNCFWGAAEFALITAVLFRSLSIAFPAPMAARFVRKNKKLTYETVALPVASPSPLNSFRFRTGLAAALSAGVMYSLYSGSTAFLSLVVASWVLHMVPGGPNMSVRRMTQFLLAGLAAIPTLVGLIFALVWAFDSGENTKSTEPEVQLNSPSEWITRLMILIQDAYPFIFPGMICAITLRYEHMRDVEPPKRMATPAALELANLEQKSTPMFFASVISLFAATAGMDLLVHVFPKARGVIDQPVFQLYVAVPAVLLTIAGTAACKGQLSEWWSYSETWIPKEEDIEDLDHIERTLNEKV